MSKRSKRKGTRQKSVFELYPLPFLKHDSKGGRMWNVKPTGDYEVDCEIGSAYARALLKTADGTVGWSVFFGWIIADMIRAGTEGVPGNKEPKINGIVIGFNSVIGEALSVAFANKLERNDPAESESKSCWVH
jgi:hypothetical protein